MFYFRLSKGDNVFYPVQSLAREFSFPKLYINRTKLYFQPEALKPESPHRKPCFLDTSYFCQRNSLDVRYHMHTGSSFPNPITFYMQSPKNSSKADMLQAYRLVSGLFMFALSVEIWYR